MHTSMALFICGQQTCVLLCHEVRTALSPRPYFGIQRLLSIDCVNAV